MNSPTLAAALLLVAVPPAVSRAPFHVDPPAVRGVETASRFEPDCKGVVFQPEDSPVSRPVTLTSRQWVTDCGSSAVPGRGCRERPGLGDSLLVRLSLADRRPLLPWESDVFQVCLTGPALTTRQVSTAYDYAVISDGAADGNVMLGPGPKRALPPDPRGVQATLTPALALVFHDQWASYYPDGGIVLKVALMREVDFGLDETVVEKRVALPVADGYTIELRGAARGPGGIYYARYSIRRLGGRVSTEDETPALRTEKVSYDP